MNNITVRMSEGPPDISNRYTKLFDNSGPNSSTLYIGYALGTNQASPSTAAAVWVIQKFIFDANNNVSEIRWANGGDSNVWDNRAALTYY